LAETGAEGIGLFRTELQYMIAHQMPRLAQMVELYSAVLDAAGDKPVVFRTLDLGGDKILPYARPVAEENPAMGWRAIRMALDRAVMLRYQLRALLLAAAGRNLNIMFPMVAEVAEFMKARAWVDKEIGRLAQFGREKPQTVRVGTMVEVPSLLFQLPALTKVVDFISLGSNDLMQFLFASDRGNPRLGNRYDTLSPAMLNLVASVSAAAKQYNVPVTVCGEMAGKPLEAIALIALGVRSLSMPPASIGPVKQMILSLNASKAASILDRIRQSGEASARDALKAAGQAEGWAV
jgi:phosphotransferase system enzyme I (PtsP)